MASSQQNGARMQEVDRVRNKLWELQARGGAFGGPGIAHDAQPSDILLESVRRNAGIVRWLEMKISEWELAATGKLPDLGKEIEGVNGVQYVPTYEAAWWNQYLEERKNLDRSAKMALDAGVAERQVKLAETSAQLMFRIITSALEQLGLTAEQEERVPAIMATVLTRSQTETGAIE